MCILKLSASVSASDHIRLFHLPPGIIANLCTECDISGGTVLVALLARLSASRIKMCGCFRLVDYCTNVSPGFVKEVVFLQRWSLRLVLLLCVHISWKWFLPLTLTGNTKIVVYWAFDPNKLLL